MVTLRHKVFISHYHKDDRKFAYELADNYDGLIIDKSLYDDIGHLMPDTILNRIRSEHLTDSTVTVVLVGLHTWGRKWVDWEIYASLRPYGIRTRNGLVGLYLPEHSRKHFRLTDNLLSGYAVPLKWNDVYDNFIHTVHKAWNGRRRPWLIDNRRQLRINNAPLKKKRYV